MLLILAHGCLIEPQFAAAKLEDQNSWSVAEGVICILVGVRYWWHLGFEQCKIHFLIFLKSCWLSLFSFQSCQLSSLETQCTFLTWQLNTRYASLGGTFILNDIVLHHSLLPLHSHLFIELVWGICDLPTQQCALACQGFGSYSFLQFKTRKSNSVLLDQING